MLRLSSDSRTLGSGWHGARCGCLLSRGLPFGWTHPGLRPSSKLRSSWGHSTIQFSSHWAQGMHRTQKPMASFPSPSSGWSWPPAPSFGLGAENALLEGPSFSTQECRLGEGWGGLLGPHFPLTAECNCVQDPPTVPHLPASQQHPLRDPGGGPGPAPAALLLPGVGQCRAGDGRRLRGQAEMPDLPALALSVDEWQLPCHGFGR